MKMKHGLKWLKHCILKLCGYLKILTQGCKKPGRPKKCEKKYFWEKSGESRKKSVYLLKNIWKSKRTWEKLINLNIHQIFLTAVARNRKKLAFEEYWEIRCIHLEMFLKVHKYFKKYLKRKFVRSRCERV